jgi:hypothetical protein
VFDAKVRVMAVEVQSIVCQRGVLAGAGRLQ